MTTRYNRATRVFSKRYPYSGNIYCEHHNSKYKRVNNNGNSYPNNVNNNQNNGNIIDIGTHDELLERCQIYQEIHYSQNKKETK